MELHWEGSAPAACVIQMSNATIYVFVSFIYLFYKYCYPILTRKEARSFKKLYPITEKYQKPSISINALGLGQK